MRPRLFFAIGAIAFSWVLAGVASAATVIPGYAVAGLGQTTEVGLTAYRDLDGNGSTEKVVKYYIPLTPYGAGSGSSGTYAVSAGGTTGVVSDSSTAAEPSGWLDMYLRFTPIEEAGPHFLRLYFEDLDLNGVNDPANFLEDISIYSGSDLVNPIGQFTVGGNYTGNSLGTPSPNLPDPPYAPGDYSVVSNPNYQQITLYYVDVPDDTDFYIKLHFTSDYERVYNNCRLYHGHTYCYNYCQTYFDKITNTPEYLRAEIEAWPPPIPVPAAMPLFLSGLAALGYVGRRRMKKKGQTA